MSRLVFNGATHQISLIDGSNQSAGAWAAYNNVDHHATLTHLENQLYSFQDTRAPHAHQADADGPYGLHGIFRFNVAGHPGIGVHSGRAHAAYAPGPQHATMGCIRTTDEAMAAIIAVAKVSPLTTIEVIHNGAPAAHAATRRHRHHALHGRTHG